MSYRKGLLWISKQTLMIQPNATCNTISPLLQRGQGYRLPTDTSFAPLTNADSLVTSQEIVEATNLFYNQGIHPHTICFGGGYSEPIASFPAVLDAMSTLRSNRHGVPLVIQTNGISNSNYSGDAAQDIIALHEEWRDTPGSDGDSKLSVWVNIAAASPPQYQKVMEPTETKQGFQEMCSFVTRLTEAGVKVYGTGSEHPKVKMKQVQQMAMGIGCSDCFVRTYHAHTLYNVLDVLETDTDATIKLAYHTKAKELHPDLNRGNEEECVQKMIEVTEAYGILSDSEKREMYDHTGVADLILNENETDYFTSSVNKSA